MSSICLVSPPSPFLIDEKVFPPLGLLYIGRELKDLGHDVAVHDGSIKDIPQGYEYYGVSITTPQFPVSVEVLREIKDFGNCKVIAGGPHASIDPDSCLDAGFDSVVMQAGEPSIPLVIKHKCRVIETPLSTYKHPDRSLIDLKSYHYKIDGRPATSVMTTRGCPYRCGFCCKVNKKLQVLPAEYVIEELRELKDVYGYKAFMFFDDIFIQNNKRLLTILDEITPWDVRWRGFARADMVVRNGPDIAQRMYESGCREVGMGIESGSDEILKTILKDETTDTMKRSIEILKKQGIRVKGFIIVGLPGESWETISMTERFIKESGIDDVDFTIYTPYKKSMIYENKKNLDIFWDEIDLKHSWYKGKPGEYESNVWTSKMSRQDIVKARDLLETEFKKWGEHGTGARFVATA